MAHLPIYYINMMSRPDRRAFMDNQLAGLGLSGTRVEAATPADIDPVDLDAYCNRSRRRFLRENELACILSHQRAWRTMLADGHDRALFLEDDAYLSSLLPPLMDALAAQPFDVIRLEAVGKKARVLPAAVSINGLRLRPFRTTTFGSAGYVLTASAIDRIMDDPGLRQSPIDVALFSPFKKPGSRLDRVLADPAVVVQLVKPAAEGATSVVGKSDIKATAEAHVYAQKHPLRFRLASGWDGLVASVRNSVDHLVNLPRGLAYRRILFERGVDQPHGIIDDSEKP